MQNFVAPFLSLVLLPHGGVQPLPVVTRYRTFAITVELSDRANQVADEGIRPTPLKKWREPLPGGRCRFRQHRIAFAPLRRERIRPHLRPPGIALLEQLQQIDPRVEQNVRDMMLVHIDDPYRAHEFLERLRHSFDGLESCCQFTTASSSKAFCAGQVCLSTK